ncbi:MAG: hypothetical protein ACKVJN_00970, partial [Woeseiales bacterium]
MIPYTPVLGSAAGSQFRGPIILGHLDIRVRATYPDRKSALNSEQTYELSWGSIHGPLAPVLMMRKERRFSVDS